MMMKINFKFLKLLIGCLVCVMVSGCMGGGVKSPEPITDTNTLQEESAHPPKSVNTPSPAVIADLPEQSVESLVPKDTAPIKGEAKPVVQGIGDNPDLKPIKNIRADAVKKELSRPLISPSDHSLPPGQPVSLNFDDADLYEVIRTMADILKINFMVSPDIRGSVTIHTAGTVTSEELFKLFFQILELNGLTAVHEGDMYKIIKMEEAAKSPILLRYGRDDAKIPKADRMVMQIIPLQHASATNLAESLPPFLSDSGSVVPTKLDNVLVVIEKNSRLKRILQLVDLFDVDVFNKFQYRFITLNYTPAENVLNLVTTLMSPFADDKTKNWKMVPIANRNMIVAVSSNKSALDRIELFVKKIDVEQNSSQSRIFVYKVKNGKAEDLASLLNQLFSQSATIDKDTKTTGTLTPNALGKVESASSTDSPPKTTTTQPLFLGANKKEKKSEDSISGYSGLNALGGEIRIVADAVQNVLIFDTSPSDYQSILKVLKELDVLPRQVLINVLVVDLTLTDDLDLGVEWEFTKGLENDTGVMTATIGSDGLNLVANLSKEWVATVSAMASKGNAEILSSPSLLASDNESATINISTQIPIESASYDSDNGVTTTTVQYRDTGIILTVIPRISDFGMVSLEIRQEVSNEVESTAGDDNPSFFTRSVDTYLTIGDGQTVVIGGLISSTKSDSTSGVPLLKDIPFLGPLFGSKGKSLAKSELAIFITPHVIKQPDDIERVSKDFLNTMKDLIRDERVKNLYQ